MSSAKIAIGTVQFGQKYGIANNKGQVPKKEVKHILKLAKDSGINILDTAMEYGVSEQVMGELGVKEFKLITKLPPIPEELCCLEKWLLIYLM